MIKITDLFNSPFVGGIIGDTNSGKSNLIYHIIEELNNKFEFKLFTYGLKYDIKGANSIYSMDELEKIKDSVIFIDEFFSLFNLDDRRNKSQAERTLRLLHHNNNIIILCGLPGNFKKFISAKINIILYKQVTFEDFINGSSVKKNVLKYMGERRGSSVLNLNKNECLIYDGEHYCINEIPYIKGKDSKRENVPILVTRNVQKKKETSDEI